MKKNVNSLISLFVACLSMTSCAYQPDFEERQKSDLLNQYAVSWIQTFGNVAYNQDWCTVSAVRAEVKMPAGVKNVTIYNADPAEGGHLIGRVSNSGTVMIVMTARNRW